MLRIATTIALFVTSAICMFSQQTIHSRVVDSKRFLPVTDECLNITPGKWHGRNELFLPTDANGQITLTIEGNQITAPAVPAKACNADSVSGPLPFDSSTHEIAILADEYVSCQYSKDLVKNPTWQNESPAQRIPSFSIEEILSHGVAASNSCSKRSPTAKPGELVLVVRKRTFWEGMKS